MMADMIYNDLDYMSLRYPDDISLTAKLDAVPGFKKFMLDTICVLNEKYVGIQFAGNGLRVTEESLPEIYQILRETCAFFGITNYPEFSLKWHYDISATTEGANQPRITALSGAVDLLDDNELKFIIGHELGHQLCGHKPYHIFLESLYTPVINSIPGGEAWVALVRTTLVNWYRVSDYTADRFGLLACRDIEVALRTMIKRAGIPKRYYDSININAFIKQAEEFDIMVAGNASKFINYVSLNSACMPWMVARAAKLMEWYKSTEYQDIVNKYRI